MGPWTLSYHLYGVQRFLMDTILDPDKVWNLKVSGTFSLDNPPGSAILREWEERNE